jgi:hypothetical protein
MIMNITNKLKNKLYGSDRNVVGHSFYYDLRQVCIIYVYEYTCLYAKIFIYLYFCINMNTYVYRYLFINVRIHMNMYTYIYTYTCIYTFKCTFTYRYVQLKLVDMSKHTLK